MCVPYSENAPDVEEALSSRKCVNHIVSEKPEWQAHLSPQGILSILMVPLFLRDYFWGFVDFDDCHRERIFSADEESILRSASLLIAHALLRNEMTLNIQTAVAEAQASSRAKSNFCHEMRTPMKAIIGMTSIGKSASDIERKNYAFEKIEDASTHLLGVINDILDMSKIEANKFELSIADFDFVEDVEINCEIVTALLEPTGIAIECAENGEDAVRLLKENPEQFDIIFIDVQMPVMDGY